MKKIKKLEKIKKRLLKEAASFENIANKTWEERAELVALYLRIIEINISLGIKYV